MASGLARTDHYGLEESKCIKQTQSKGKMKMKHVKLILGLVIGVYATLWGSFATAATIIDSGPGSQTGGYNLDFQDQWLAQQFTTSQAYQISGIEGWMGAYVPGDVTLALYSDVSGRPGEELFTSVFNVDGRLNDWYGATDLFWNLDVGTYWAAFEVRSGQGMRGYMGGGPTYQVGYGAWRGPGGNWAIMSSDSLGLRVYGDVATVPAPPAFILMATALGLLGLTRRNKV